MKTRTIIVTTSSDKRSELERDYGIKTVRPEETVTFEMQVPDTSEIYKKLSKDLRIQDWSFKDDKADGDETTTANRIPVISNNKPRNRNPRPFDTYDLKDLKTVLRILGGFKRTIEFYLISDSTSKTTLDVETLLDTALGNPTKEVPSIISADLTKKVLICMAAGPTELKRVLTTGFERILESKIPVDSMSFEGFCDILLTKGNE